MLVLKLFHKSTRLWSFFPCCSDCILFIGPSSHYGLQRKATKDGNTLCSIVYLGADFNSLFQKFPTCVFSVESRVVVFVFLSRYYNPYLQQGQVFRCSLPSMVSRNEGYYLTLKSAQSLLNPLQLIQSDSRKVLEVFS